MSEKIELLQLSPTMSEGTIVKWLVKEGDDISSGQAIAEIETDKAVMEQESFYDGKALKIVAKEGDKVAVGGLLMIVGEEGEDTSASEPEAKKEEAPRKETAKAPAAKQAKSQPDEEEQDADEEQDQKEQSGGKKQEAAKSAPGVTAGGHASRKPPLGKRKPGGNGASSSSNSERVMASPVARKMAEEGGVDLSQISGSGPAGRVVKADVEAALTSSDIATTTEIYTGEAEPGAREEKVSGMRQTIARRLVQSKQSVPHFQLTVEIRMEKVLDVVSQIRDAKPEAKVTVTHFLIKAMAAAAMRHSAIRTQWAGDHLTVQEGAPISVAVAIEEGLVTPVLRRAESKGVLQIAAELRDLAEKARARKLTAEQMSGGVQTLSNLGMFGIHAFNAIINPPESSILAAGAVEDRPVVDNGAVVPGKVMTLTASFDHRVIDGAVGAKYLADLKTSLENPALILM